MAKLARRRRAAKRKAMIAKRAMQAKLDKIKKHMASKGFTLIILAMQEQRKA